MLALTWVIFDRPIGSKIWFSHSAAAREQVSTNVQQRSQTDPSRAGAGGDARAGAPSRGAGNIAERLCGGAAAAERRDPGSVLRHGPAAARGTQGETRLRGERARPMLARHDGTGRARSRAREHARDVSAREV